MSIIDESGDKFVRMAHLACVGSKHINGVAELHTQLLKSDLLRDFHDLCPNKFINVTNGVTPRRWLAVSNPEQAKLMTGKVGESWISNLEHLKQLEAYAEDSGFRAAWRKTQYDVKVRLAQYILEDTGYSVDPASMFDTQVKRLHEYKRQHLNVLYILTLYLRLKRNPRLGRYWASGRVITSDSSLFSRGRCVRARRTADPSAALPRISCRDPWL
jgi:glycogen phosphorylase